MVLKYSTNFNSIITPQYYYSNKIRKLYYLLIQFKILDILTTFIGVELLNRKEINPLGYNGAMIGSLILLVVLVYLYAYGFSERANKKLDKKGVYFLLLIPVCIQIVIVIHNFLLILYHFILNNRGFLYGG